MWKGGKGSQNQKKQEFSRPQGVWINFWVVHTRRIKKIFIHTSQFTFPQKPVEKLFVLSIDVGFDILDDFGQIRVVFHPLFHALNGMENSGMVAVAEFLANVVQG